MARAGDGGEDKTAAASSAPTSTNSILDTSRADKAVWLLKLPPRVSHTWQKQAETGTRLAKLVLTIDPKKFGAEPQFSLQLAENEAGGVRDYILNSNKDLVPMHIFSESAQGKLIVEGKVDHKFDMKPNTMVNDDYRKLCRDRLDKSRIKTRTVQVLDKDHGDLMRPQPVAIGPTYTAKKKATVSKAPDTKRIRIERADLEDLVFKLFEQQSYWTLKMLVAETQQPEAFLKEVMSDLCNYNKRGPNQGKYELKPEFRKASTEEEKPAE